MLRPVSVNFILFSMLMDAVQVTLALRIASAVRPDARWLPFSRPISSTEPLAESLYLAAPLIWLLVLNAFALYDPERHFRFVDETGRVFLAGVVASLASAGLLYLSYRGTSRWLFLLFAFLATAFPVLWRGVARLIIRIAGRKEPHVRRVAVVGTGALAREAAAAIVTYRWAGLRLVGFVDCGETQATASAEPPGTDGTVADGPGADGPVAVARRRVQPTAPGADHQAGRGREPLPGPTLGRLDDVRAVVADHRIEDVVIALPGTAYDRVQQLVATLHDLPVRVLLVPDYLTLVLHRARAQDFAGIPMVDLRAPALSECQRLAKRAFDLVVGSLCLVAALPLMAVIALAIKWDSKGPAIFRQVRVGENGRPFAMYKFRTMRVDAERQVLVTIDQNGHLLHKRPDDPRVTRVGRFLRRTSLDELPQLFNVLKGDMSLVGPRPELPWLVQRYEGWQRRRFAVPQGLTGWWQVNGRSDRPMHLHTEDDLYYLQHYSFWLDLQILWRTIWIVLRGRGAY